MSIYCPMRSDMTPVSFQCSHSTMRSLLSRYGIFSLLIGVASLDNSTHQKKCHGISNCHSQKSCYQCCSCHAVLPLVCCSTIIYHFSSANLGCFRNFFRFFHAIHLSCLIFPLLQLPLNFIYYHLYLVVDVIFGNINISSQFIQCLFRFHFCHTSLLDKSIYHILNEKWGLAFFVHYLSTKFKGLAQEVQLPLPTYPLFSSML